MFILQIKQDCRAAQWYGRRSRCHIELLLIRIIHTQNISIPSATVVLLPNDSDLFKAFQAACGLQAS